MSSWAFIISVNLMKRGHSSRQHSLENIIGLFKGRKFGISTNLRVASPDRVGVEQPPLPNNLGTRSYWALALIHISFFARQESSNTPSHSEVLSLGGAIAFLGIAFSLASLGFEFGSPTQGRFP